MVNNDLEELRNISNFYYKVNGIYQTVSNYFAFLYRYDWYMVPEVFDNKVKEEVILKDYYSILNFLDNSHIKKLCGDIALEVVKNGCYYGYLVPSDTQITIQQLPVKYCRTRYEVNGCPAVEFDMSYFDTFNIQQRTKILDLFPREFKKGYILYKERKLPSDSDMGFGSWFMLEPSNCVKFNCNKNDVPMFVNATPYLIDLEAAQALDRKKQLQKLLKIVTQKIPLDKNGDLIFGMEEIADIHKNTVDMLSGAVGVNVMTTFADVDSIDISDKNTSTSSDDLERIERAAYNAFGISQNLFNTDGNMSLDKSILNDESSMRDLLFQFNIFFNKIITNMNIKNKKKYHFTLYMLETTQYNYRDLAKIYKDQTTIGNSKMLAQIALGHSQSFILNSAYFENKVLHLTEVMIPPLSSNTMSSSDILKTESGDAGRPELPDDQKSDKTILNRESMS